MLGMTVPLFLNRCQMVLSIARPGLVRMLLLRLSMSLMTMVQPLEGLILLIQHYRQLLE
jgi:hypothetical protein